MSVFDDLVLHFEGLGEHVLLNHRHIAAVHFLLALGEARLELFHEIKQPLRLVYLQQSLLDFKVRGPREREPHRSIDLIDFRPPTTTAPRARLPCKADPLSPLCGPLLSIGYALPMRRRLIGAESWLFQGCLSNTAPSRPSSGLGFGEILLKGRRLHSAIAALHVLFAFVLSI